MFLIDGDVLHEKILNITEFEPEIVNYFIDLVDSQEEVFRWIPINEELPPKNAKVLLSDGDDIQIGTYRAQKNITHWMRLPEPPNAY